MSKIWKYLRCNTKTDEVDEYFGDYRDLKAKRMLMHEFQDMMISKFRGSLRSRAERAQAENEANSENQENRENIEPCDNQEIKERPENLEIEEKLENEGSSKKQYKNQSFILKHAEEHELPSFMFAPTSSTSNPKSSKIPSNFDSDSEEYEQNEASILVPKSPPHHVYDTPEGCDNQLAIATLQINSEPTTYVNVQPGIDETTFHNSPNSDSNKETVETEPSKKINPPFWEVKSHPRQLLTEIKRILNKQSEDMDEITIWDVKEARRSLSNENRNVNDAGDASKESENESGCFPKFGDAKNCVLPRGVDPRKFNHDIIRELKAKFNEKN